MPLTNRTRERPQPHQKAGTERDYLNLRLNFEEVAEFDHQPSKCSRPYRVVALRKNISRMEGENVRFDEIRYFFDITTRTDLSAAWSAARTSAAIRTT